MLSAAQRKQILKNFAAYAPVRATLKDPPRHKQAPQPRTARLARVPLEKRRVRERSEKEHPHVRRIPWSQKIASVKHIHQRILDELNGVKHGPEVGC
jgi:hypothetical protein